MSDIDKKIQEIIKSIMLESLGRIYIFNSQIKNIKNKNLHKSLSLDCKRGEGTF